MIFLCLAIYYARQNYNYVCLFKNSLVRPRTGVVAAKIGCKMGQNLTNGPVKRGQKIMPPKISVTFFNSNFYVDYDFAIKHDLLLFSD